jgi:hypothetical protein
MRWYYTCQWWSATTWLCWCIVFMMMSPHLVSAKKLSPKTVSIFILAGDDNVEGYASIAHLYNVTTQYNPSNPNELHPAYQHLLEPVTASSSNSQQQQQRQWAVHPHVYVTYDHDSAGPWLHGPLRVDGGFGSDAHTFGPEVELGWVLGEVYSSQHPIVICKTGWTGKTLAQDFRSPSSSNVEGLAGARSTGYHWYRILSNVRRTMDHIGDILGPQYQHYTPQVEAFIWWHGYTDIFAGTSKDDYQLLLINLLRDIRQEFGHPPMNYIPLLIAELGGTGDVHNRPSSKEIQFRRMQHAVTELMEFNFSSRFVKTSHFVPPQSPPHLDTNVHYYGRGDIMVDIGGALARQYLDLVNSYTGPWASSTAYQADMQASMDMSHASGKSLLWMGLWMGTLFSMVMVYRGRWNRQWCMHHAALTLAALRSRTFLSLSLDRPASPPPTMISSPDGPPQSHSSSLSSRSANSHLSQLEMTQPSS